MCNSTIGFGSIYLFRFSAVASIKQRITNTYNSGLSATFLTEERDRQLSRYIIETLKLVTQSPHNSRFAVLCFVRLGYSEIRMYSGIFNNYSTSARSALLAIIISYPTSEWNNCVTKNARKIF